MVAVTFSMDYYGVDSASFDSTACGAAFCSRVDIQNQVVASTNVAILDNGSYVKIDNLEIKNLYWTGTSQEGAILLGATSGMQDVLSNLYIHNWTHDPGNGTQDVFHAVASIPRLREVSTPQR